MSVEALRRHSPPRPADHPEPSRTDTRRSGVRPVAIHTTEASRSLAARASRTGRIVGPNAAERRIAGRLNDFRQKMGGPYEVNGKQVFVSPAFRMNGGMNQLAKPEDYLPRIVRALGPKTYRELRPVIGTVVAGKGTPDELRRVTQALIDSPAFAKYSSMPPKQAVRELMWHFGIGMDCSGYVHRAFLYSRGSGPDSAPSSKYGLGSALSSKLQHMPTPAFKRVSPADARAGDIVVLTHGPDGTGHKLIVFDHDRLGPGGAMHRVLERDLGSSPTAHIDLFQVDSSWGAGGEPMQGGVGREFWAYDEGSGKWATLVKDDSNHWHAFASDKSGPYDHDLQGFYRPKAEN